MDKFESAARAALFEWADSIPEEFESFEHSEKYDKAIARLFDKMRDGRYHRFTRTTARVILAAAVLLLAATVAFASTVGRDFIIERYKTFASYIVSDRSGSAAVGDLTVNYIPEGFELVEEEKTDLHVHMRYANIDKEFLIQKDDIGLNIDFDSETILNEINYNNTTYILFKTSNESVGVIWNANGYLYKATGNLDKEDIFKIATGVS